MAIRINRRIERLWNGVQFELLRPLRWPQVQQKETLFRRPPGLRKWVWQQHQKRWKERFIGWGRQQVRYSYILLDHFVKMHVSSTLTFLVPRPGYLITNRLHPHDFRRRRSSGSSSTGRGSRRGSGEEEDPPPDDLEEDWPSAPPIDILDSIKVKHLSSNVLETCHS